MKHALWLALFALAVPLTSLADSVGFTNSGGTLTGTSSGFALSSSEVIAINGLNGMGLVTGDLGTLSFTTGSLVSGSLSSNATFNAGGTFLITGNGTNGIPSGTLFSGSFDSPVTWTGIKTANGTVSYTLGGTVTGTWGSGGTAYGVVVELTIKGAFNGSTTISSGDINIVSSVVPEPGSLILMGTGLLVIAGGLRLKFKA
jgi:hypothetical protein